MAEFTFFVAADLYLMNGGELAATEEDLFDRGIRSVEIPDGFDLDLSERIPVRVTASPAGLRFYAKLLGLRDALQLEELERCVAAAELRGDD